MMNVTVAGRIYNGKVHDWEQKRDDEEIDRSLFRGRLNYRNPENGEYHYIDAVCFKDFGDKGGLVAWLDEHYSAENSDSSDKGGDAIIVTGYVRPNEKKKTVKLKWKDRNGKLATRDIPNVPYDSFELVILSATFPPTSQGTSRKSDGVDAEDDFDGLDDIDDLQVADNENEEDVAEEVEDEVEEEKASKKKTSTNRRTNSEKKKPADKKGQKKPKKQDDDDFFDE